MRSILIISPEPWSAHTVSKHHYATTLSALGFAVYFLNPPVDNINTMEIEQVVSHPGLHIVSARKVATGLRFFPPPVRRRKERHWLEELERKAGTTIDIIWLFENSRFFDLSFAGSRLKIYHQVDLNQSFHPGTAASTADICFCTTDLIRERLLSANERVYKIHHGLAQVDKAAQLTPQQQRALEGNRVNAIYVGNLDLAYVDVDLIHDVATAHQSVSFHLVGGYRADGPMYRRCGHLPNITWWGKVESAVIPSILQRADVLLVAYKAQHWRDQTASPHKFMEYLASGKVVVATYTGEYKNRKQLLEMVDNSDDYVDMFARVVGNLDTYNDGKKMNERKRFALDHTYQRQVIRIDSHLRENGLPGLLKD